MSLPIKYSYSGADCKAVAFYSDVDDYAYYVKDIKDFFVYTATNTEAPVSLSSDQLKEILKNPDKLPASENNYFDWGFQREKIDLSEVSAANAKAFAAGQKQRELAEKKLQARAKKASSIIPLDSLATISYSIYEAKSPVRRLGERGVSGYTRGIRTIAGSMVFLVIEEHPLHRLIELQRKSKNWSRDLNSKGHSFRAVQKGGEGSPKVTNFVSTILEPFNIGLFYKTEVAFSYSKNEDKDSVLKSSGYVRSGDSGAHLVISGIDIISEGMVTSVNDMVTEVTVQFVAQDVFNIEKVDHYSIGTIAEYEKNVQALSRANVDQGRPSEPRAYKSDLYNTLSASRKRGGRLR